MVITSRHVLTRQDLPDLPVIAVGEETAAMAIHYGLKIIQTGDGGIQQLNLDQDKKYLYPCALEPTPYPQNLSPWPVYQAVENGNFYIDDGVTHIAVFSVRAANYIKRHINQSHSVLCFSPAIAAIFNKDKIQNLAACAEPRYDAMIDLILKETTAHT
jgi:uroporphyrinogen-III synthase